MSLLQLEVLKVAPLIFFTGLYAGAFGGLLSAKTAGKFTVLIALACLALAIVIGIVACLVFASL